MRDSRCTQAEVVNLLNVVLDTYTLNYPDKLKRKNSSVKNEVMTAVAGFTTYDALLEDTTSILMTLRRDDETDRYERLAEDIEEYIKQNYTRTITSETLSREFGFVPSYISRIFKQKKHISPSEYITKYRIKLAKKLMTDNPDIMIKEVANETGFKEAYYFSKTFKRETGMWPTEFMGKSDLKET
jgi:YesN/AraC family two-component response regulator